MILLADLDTPSSFRRFADGKAVFRKNRKTTYRAATAGVKAKSLVPPEDPYGRATKVSGSLSCDFQFAGMYEHATSGLNLTPFRAYNPNTGTWISRDPSGEGSGLNLYAYCANNPINHTTPPGYARIVRLVINMLPEEDWDLAPLLHSWPAKTWMPERRAIKVNFF